MTDLPDIRSKWRFGGPFIPIAAAACVGLAVAISSWLAVSAWEQRLAKATFNDVAGDYASVLQNGLDQYLGKILAIRAFYDSSHSVEPDEFELFTSRLLQGQSSLMRVTWSPLVTRDERATFEARARAEVFADYVIKSWAPSGTMPPEPEHDDYFPILYTTDLSKNASLLGIDLASEPGRRQALERARDGDRMATAPNIRLRHAENVARHGFFVALPVYLPDLPHNTVEERQRNTLGILGAVFQTAPVLDAILKAAALPPSVDVSLYAADAGPDVRAVYVRSSPLHANPVRPRTRAEVLALPHWAGTLTAGDANWDLVVTPMQGGLTSFYRAWIVVVIVVLMFAAVLAYMWASVRNAMRLEQVNKQVIELARTDLLTSLANRRGFLNRLGSAFAASRRGAPPFAVLYLDIDDFKDVNDTLGHPMGDELLKHVVKQLQRTVKADDLVARFGGDEFAILQTGVIDPTMAGALAAEIGKQLAMSFDIDGHQVRITSSVGISLYTPELADPETMMIQADLALYGAKAEGRNRYRFHSLDLDQQVHERVTVAEELRRALEDGDLELYYQPQVELATGRIIGLEALVRWNHRTRGLLLPSCFIPIAERTGAILPLGKWVIEEACRQLEVWRSEGIAPVVMAVNVSGIQFKGASELKRDVEASLGRSGVEPGHLELELTESVLMEATQKHSDTLDELRQLGIGIAIDDFGTGYSSLKYLTVYPVNRLKLAQELVFRVTVDYRNAAVVRAAIRLAHELGVEVIAEGVETEAQVRFLMAAGCEQAQGYYFSRPVTAERAGILLRAGRIEPTAPQPSALTSTAA
ncbi:MAG: putative bifunctional diguanylate cyclase/phosphodiesterase [Methyloceanibacter sp.]